MVASDHSPAPASMKVGDDFFKIWGGISGCQSTLQLLLTHGYHERDLPLATIASATSAYVAKRFGLDGRKGRIAVGADADLALVDLNGATVLRGKDLHYRHKHTPYAGRQLRGIVCRTILRGTTVRSNGAVMSRPIGRLVRPTTGT